MSYVQSAGQALTFEEVQGVHHRALMFFTPAMFFIFIAVGVLASRMLHGFIHSRWLGVLGMFIEIAGSLSMLAMVWTVLVGFAALFGCGVRHVD